MSIRSQALLLLLGPNVLAIVIACSLLVQFAARHQLLTETKSLAELVGVQSLLGLSKGDDSLAEVALLAVTSNDRVEAAAVYSNQGALVAQFRRDYATGRGFPDKPGEAGHRFVADSLEVFVPAEAGGRSLGSIFVRTRTTGLWDDALAFAPVAGLAALLGLVPALCALYLLSRRVVTPVEQIAQEAEAYAAGDLRERDLPVANGEVGELVSGFARLGNSLRDLVRNVRAELLSVDGARATLFERSRVAAARASEQADSVDSAASSLEGLGEGFDSIAAALDQLSGEAKTSASVSVQIQAGAQSVREASQSLLPTTERISSATEETTAAMEQISVSVAEQERHGNQASAALAELAKSIATVRSRAEKVGVLSRESEGEVRRGQAAATESAQAMAGVASCFSEIETEVSKLDHVSGEIEGILSAIEDISSKTQLLSLNASIIAAQVGGDAGQAFAVVADEVSSLATATAQATGNIGNLVSSVQGAVSSAVKVTESGREAVEAGESTAQQVTNALSQISTRSGAAAEYAEQNGVVALSQGSALEAVEGQMELIRESVAHVLGAVREQERAAREISNSVAEGHDLAQQLRSAADEQSEACAVASRSAAGVDALAAQMTELVTGQRRSASSLRESLPVFRENVRSAQSEVDHLTDLVRDLDRRGERLRRGIEDLEIE